MRKLIYANWKKEIAFDNVVYKDVKRYSLTLNSYEREIMDIQINYYRNNFSLLQVMNHFKKLHSKSDKETFIKAVLKRQENLLYIPHSLEDFFKKKISSEFSDYKDFFLLLLDKCLHKQHSNNTIQMVKKILGKHYGYVKANVYKYARQNEIKCRVKKLSPISYENLAREQIEKLRDNLHMAQIFGRSSIRKSIPISVVDEYGYGEWVSKNVTLSSNRFFLYSNNNNLTDLQLEHMVYFNVYPGLGHLYSEVLDDNLKINFDSGATCLLNGWAMYAMCHSRGSAYSTNYLIEGSYIAKNLLRKNLQKGYENIYVYLLGKYAKNKALDYMLDYTQYPCHYLSYILGEFATESAIKKGFAYNPIDYINTLRTINCGDFFAIYHPSMQKKIARNSITALVSKKFQ